MADQISTEFDASCSKHGRMHMMFEDGATWCEACVQESMPEAPPPPKCLTLRVTFMDNAVVEYPVHDSGTWGWRFANEDVPQLVVRPWGKGGNARHHIPLGNVRSVMVVGLKERG